MVQAPTLIQQLHGKVDELRRMSDQLRQGDFLRSVIAQANDQSVWVRGPQIAFTGWIQALDAWMRNQLVGSLDAVRQRIEAYVRDFDNAQQAFANGIPGVALPPPPAPVGATPPSCPYPFVMEVPKGTNPSMNPDLMRKGLGNALGRAKEEIHAFSQRLGDVLTEPAPAPSAPTVPGAPPLRHLPPDAKEAAGVPNAFLAIEAELEKALLDIMDRAQTWEEAQAADESPSLGGGLLGLGLNDFRATVAKLDELARAEAQQVPLPQPTPEAQAPDALPAPTGSGPPPRTPEEQQAARDEADRVAAQFPPEKALEDPAQLKRLSDELKKHENDPDFSAQFVRKFGAKNVVAIPRAIQAWQNGWDRFNVPTEDPHHRPLGVGKANKKPSKEDVEGVLYGFSVTLATATTQMSPEEEDEVIKAGDPLAVSWLLSVHEAHFDPEFLLRAFEVNVKNVIIDQAAQKGQGYAYGELRRLDPPLSLTKWNLYADPKVATLNAISRNPKAAAALGSMTYDPPMELRYGGGHGTVPIDSVIELLYRGDYPDDGHCLQRILGTSYDTLLKEAQQNTANSQGLRDFVKNSVAAASETKLTDESRRQLGRVLANHIDGLAHVINHDNADLRDPMQFDPALLTPAQVGAALQEVARDRKAIAPVMAGLGNWVSGFYSEAAKKMEAQITAGTFDLDDFEEDIILINNRMGHTFCEVAHSIRSAGIKNRDEALATLANFRLGVDIVFDLGKKIPVIGDVTGELGKIPGGFSGKGEEKFKDNIAKWVSGIDPEKEATESKSYTKGGLDQLDHLLLDKAMNAMGGNPVLLHQLGTPWPDFMLQSPGAPMPTPSSPTDREYLRHVLKPEYVLPDGGVRFPGPGEDTYDAYQRWCNDNDNGLSKRAQTMTKDARAAMRHCMTDIGWIDAA